MYIRARFDHPLRNVRGYLHPQSNGFSLLFDGIQPSTLRTQHLEYDL